MRRALMPLIAAAVLIGTAAPATEPKQCYRKEDCQCLFGAGTLKDGRWYAESAPGGFGNAAVGATVMHADFNYVDIIDQCDGHMDLMWADKESGLIEWKMQRISDTGSMTAEEMILANPVSKDDLAPFYIIDPNLADLAKDSVLYMGSALYNSPQGTFPATMVMAYSPLPGRADERGYAAMTMRFDVGNMQFWATTGRVDLAFADQSDEVYARRREVCRCDEIEVSLASDTIAGRLQKQILKETDGRALRRIGYDKGRTIRDALDKLKAGGSAKSAPKIRNERFDASKPWVRPTAGAPGNWPCVAPEQIDGTQKKTDQQVFKDRFEQAWRKWDHEDDQIDRRIQGLPPEPYVHVDPKELEGQAGQAKRRVKPRGWVDAENCRETVLGTDGSQHVITKGYDESQIKIDPCIMNDLRFDAVRAHEGFHKTSCEARDKEATAMGLRLANAAKGQGQIPGLTADQADQAYREGVYVCMGYPAYVGNSNLAALEESHAYEA